MPEILEFKINDARAYKDGNGLVVQLFYPDVKEQLTQRLAANPEFGSKALDDLITKGEATIADKDHPFKAAGGGSLYITSDDKIIFHRRDAGAGIHPMHHSAYGGFPDSYEGVSSAQGIRNTALRETGEECILITRDQPHRIYVPRDTREHTEQAAKRIGLDLKPEHIDVETLTGTDTLEVYTEKGKLLFRTNALLDMMWDASTSFDALFLRRLPFSSEEVLPVDAEGMMKGNRFIHFNRESYMVSLEDLRGKKPFESILENAEVYQTKIVDGIPQVFTPEYSPPFEGPESAKISDPVQVIHPHVWAPENHLTVCLDALGVEGFKGRRFEIELWKDKCVLEGRKLVSRSLISENFL